MCNAFSCVVTKQGEVYWKSGVDSHHELIDKFNIKEGDVPKEALKSNKEVAKYLNIAKIEITPENGDYLNPNKWVYSIDEAIKPDWIGKKHEQLCWKEFKKWKKEVYNFNLKEARKPIHPFKIKPPVKITKKHLNLLKQWDSVGDSVGDSVWGSVWDSVGDSVGDSVWGSVWGSVGASVGDSVGDSVGASVWAYNGSLFPNIKEWKYVDYKKLQLEKGKYPFAPVVKLWKMGLVPSFDGTTWRLHGKVRGKVKILWEGELK